MRFFVVLAMLFSVHLLAKETYMVSIIPQKALLEKIVQDRANVVVMVEKGQSPHSYEPKPSQMKELSHANVYFSIGVEFEDVWMPKFTSQNSSLVVVKSDKGIEKIAMENHSHGHEDEYHHDYHGDEHGNLDPHIWLNTSNSKKIAKNMLEALKKQEPKNAEFYEANYKKLAKHIDSIDKSIKETLKNTPPHTPFMVFHPSFGYFAKEYDLEQLPIEIEGKNPKPKELTYLIEEAKEEKVKAIFTQPEFSKKFANVISSELGIGVESFSPLSPNYLENLLSMAKIIAK